VRFEFPAYQPVFNPTFPGNFWKPPSQLMSLRPLTSFVSDPFLLVIVDPRQLVSRLVSPPFSFFFVSHYQYTVSSSLGRRFFCFFPSGHCRTFLMCVFFFFLFFFAPNKLLPSTLWALIFFSCSLIDSFLGQSMILRENLQSSD